MIERNIAKQTIIQQIFRQWRNDGVRYAIARNATQVLEGVADDIDVFVASGSRAAAEATLWSFGHLGWHVVQKSPGFANTRIVLINEVCRDSIIFDLSEHILVDGRWVPAKVMLYDLCECRGVFTLSPAAEVIHLQNRTGAKAEKYRKRIEDLKKSVSTNQVDLLWKQMKRCGKAHAHPSVRLRRYAAALGRQIRPQGIFVAVLGPDGAGKSSALREVKKRLQQLGVRHVAMHLGGKKGMLPARRRVYSGRPSKITRPRKWLRWVKSLVDYPRFVYHMLDLLIFHIARIRPELVKGTHYLADKYFTYYVKSTEMTFSLPQSVLRAALLCLPRPCAYVLLWHDPDVIVSRKNELKMEEIAVHMRKLEAQAHTARYSRKLKTNGTVEEVGTRLCNVLMSIYSQEMIRRSSSSGCDY